MAHISKDDAAAEVIPLCCWGNDISIDSELVRRNLLEIKNKIVPYKPRIIGVTKYFGRDAVVRGYEAGLRDFGESRAMDAIRKINSLPDEIRKNSTFHFIGHLQTNKAEKVVEYFDFIHSIDSLKLATAVSNAVCRLGKREKVLLQVNNAGEVQKFGYTKEQLIEDFPEIIKLDSMEVAGLMCMAPIDATKDELRGLFSDLREFRDELQKRFGISLKELSMGMSNDFEEAVAEGATMIRIGRKLFK